MLHAHGLQYSLADTFNHHMAIWALDWCIRRCCAMKNNARDDRLATGNACAIDDCIEPFGWTLDISDPQIDS